MKMSYENTARVLFLSTLLISTVSCAQQAAAPSEVAATEPVTPRTVKTGAALSYSYQMQTPIVANRAHNVSLIITHDYAGQTLSLTANSDPLVRLSAKSIAMPLIKGKVAVWTLPFTATADGVFYIEFVGTVKSEDGNTQARAYAVRVKVGDAVEIKKPAPKEIILPAEEKISGS